MLPAGLISGELTLSMAMGPSRGADIELAQSGVNCDDAQNHPPERLMAGTINVSAYSDALVVLGTAGIVVPIVSRLGFSPVLGYLGAGALLGPLGLGSLIGIISAAVLGHGRRRQGRRRHRRTRHRVSAVPDRSRTVAAAPSHHAAAGLRARRTAGARHHRPACRRGRSMPAASRPRRSSSAPACRCRRRRSCWNCCRTRSG